MDGHNKSKINRLLKSWPKGTVMTQAHLDKLGIYRQLATKYLRYNWIDRLGEKAYMRSEDTIGWEGGLYALQSHMGMSIHVGGRSALELHGRSHYIPVGQNKRVTLISDQSEHLPAWFRNHQWGVNVEHRCLSLFDNVPNEAKSSLGCGGFEIDISSAERAMMEQMSMARTNDDISHIYQLMEGLGTLRPDVIQELLENCRSVKTKRLFLWNAEMVNHNWYDRLNTSQVDLGNGKRLLYKGGEFNKEFQITVPRMAELGNV